MAQPARQENHTPALPDCPGQGVFLAGWSNLHPLWTPLDLTTEPGGLVPYLSAAGGTEETLWGLSSVAEGTATKIKVILMSKVL